MNKENEINKTVVELYIQGKTYKEIGNVLNCSEKVISRKIKKLEKSGLINETIINKRNTNIANLKEKKSLKLNTQIIQLFKQGKTYKEIASKLGCSESTIFQKITNLKRSGKIHNDIINERENNKIYNLDDLNKQIIELYGEGYSKKEIANKLNLSISRISIRLKFLRENNLLKINEEKHSAKYIITNLNYIDSQIINLYKENYTSEEIAEKLNQSHMHILRRIQILHNIGLLEVREAETFSNLITLNVLDKQIIELYNEDYTQSEIALKLHRSNSFISNRINNLKKAGILNPNRIIPRKKYTVETLDNINKQIIKLYNEGYTQKEISIKLHYAESSISDRIKHLKASGILILKKEQSTKKIDLTLFSKYLKKAKSIYYLDSRYKHSFFSEAIRQAKNIQNSEKLTLKDLDILANALLIEQPLLENVINISRLYVGIKQYSKCILFLKQSKEFFNEEQNSKINELISEIKIIIENNHKDRDR